MYSARTYTTTNNNSAGMAQEVFFSSLWLANKKNTSVSRYFNRFIVSLARGVKIVVILWGTSILFYSNPVTAVSKTG